jgi:cyclopropane-fatty-acyl-phospholipid synthase
LLHFQDDFAVEAHWRLPGTHYAKTAAAWLANLDRERARLAPLLHGAYGARAGAVTNLWRVFLLACGELWGFADGREWLVSHYLLRRRARVA